MKTQHQNLAAGRWFTLSLAEQMGNIGSEFYRARNFQSRGDEARFKAAQGRFFELIDLTLSDARWDLPRRKEIAHAREQALVELENPQNSKLGLQKYFDQFAYLARAKR